jgi:hypothetical protein
MHKRTEEKAYTEAEALEVLRSKVQAILDQGLEEGIITPGVHDQKSRQTEAAGDPGALENIVESLPGQEKQSGKDQAMALTPGYKDYFTIMAENRHMSPELLRDRVDSITVMGETTLDFSRLDWDGQVEVQVTAVMASVKIIVSPETKVDFGVTAFMADAKDRRKSFGNSISKQLSIRGIAVMAEVKVLG